MFYSFNTRLRAYGLIEIMLVLIVVGLLLKGSLGQFMNHFDDAKVKASLAQYNKILNASLSFQDRFGYLPGDFPHAREEFGGDTPNGDGNHELSGNGLGAPRSSKAALFWLHLFKAHLLTDAGTPDASSELKFGKGAPRSDFESAGFSVVWNPEEWGGHWLVLGTQTGTHGDGAAFTPAQAKLFLQQLGLEETQSGNLRIGTGRGSSEACLQADKRLNFRNSKKSCVIYFRLDA